jgi:hypothetical protein
MVIEKFFGCYMDSNAKILIVRSFNHQVFYHHKNLVTTSFCWFRIMQIKLNFIYNNYKLYIVTFDNIHQMESNYIYGGPIHVRIMWWNIHHAFEFDSYMSWIIFPNDNLV